MIASGNLIGNEVAKSRKYFSRNVILCVSLYILKICFATFQKLFSALLSYELWVEKSYKLRSVCFSRLFATVRVW